MKPYLLSAAIGVLVGVIYALFGVRSPAPPVIALVGLLGILVGEQLPPLVRNALSSERISWLENQVKPHVFGRLPECKHPPTSAETAASPATPTETTHV